MVLVQMRPEGISAGNKLLTELTIISTGHMLALYMLVQMRSIHSCVVAVSADPGTVDLHYFGLDEVINLSFWKALKSVMRIYQQGGFSKCGIGEHFARGRTFDSTDSCSQRMYASPLHVHTNGIWWQ